jgi:hypothetical protein
MLVGGIRTTDSVQTSSIGNHVPTYQRRQHPKQKFGQFTVGQQLHTKIFHAVLTSDGLSGIRAGGCRHFLGGSSDTRNSISNDRAPLLLRERGALRMAPKSIHTDTDLLQCIGQMSSNDFSISGLYLPPPRLLCTWRGLPDGFEKLCSMLCRCRLLHARRNLDSILNI